MLGQTRPKLICCDADNVSVIKEAATKIDLATDILTFDKRINGTKITDLFKPLGNDSIFESPKISDPDKYIAAITCSSGTTGYSKGVMLTHKSFLAQNS